MRRAVLALFGLYLGTAPLQAGVYAVGMNKNSYTSDFMMGKVVVAIVFPESNGVIDPNTETWSQARKTQVVSEIMAGHQWWTQQNPRSPLTFTYVVETLPTKYEPINRCSYCLSGEGSWIPDTLSSLGYTGSRFVVTKDYINALRTQHNADWGFVIFVVDSANDTNGKFTDSYFAYAYLGGPYMVMTYDNGGYGISNMDVVAAHETGHIFHALDQYMGGSSPYDYSFGYFPTINGNHELAPVNNQTNASSIMRGGLRWGLDNWARLMIGWRDSNANNVDDILDQTPDVTISQQTLAAGGGGTIIQGQAKIKVLPRQGNAQGNGMTLDTISKVQYHYGVDTAWQEASAADGTFNGAEESFQILVPPSSAFSLQSSGFNPSSINLQVQAITNFSQGANTSATGPQVTAAGALDLAHPRPNPFKPNSGLGHSDILFTGITAGAKIQIFSPVGEPLYDAVNDSGNDFSWNGRDKDGNNLGSGVYFYLITDEDGNKKEGKLAVIR